MTSLIITTFNRKQQLVRGLKTILKQELLPDEIIVVDDGSQDGTEEAVKDLVKYIYLDYPEPRISSIPRNVGIKQSKGDTLIFTEPEILHVGNTIKQLLEKLEEHDKPIVATQVWTIQREIYKKLSEEEFETPARILSHPFAQLTDNENLHNTKATNSDWAITGSNNCITGCLFAVKRKWIMDIGGFDESFEGFGFDDFDLFARLGLYGKAPVWANDIKVIHQWHEKNYPYNIYEASDKNGKISEKNIKEGKYKVNKWKRWGMI